MAKMLKDEIQILKAVLIEVDQDTVALVTEQYHTEANDTTGKTDRSKSFYRWVARAWKKADYQKMIADLTADDARLQRGRWPDDTIDYYLCVGNSSNNYAIASFLSQKFKKLRTWDLGQKILQGWQTKTAKREEGYNPGAKYQTEGYQTPDGKTVSILDKATFLDNLNVNLVAKHRTTTKTLPAS